MVDFGVSNLLIKLFNTRLVIAGTISFIAAIISNFIWNRYWTYPDSRSKPIARQLVQFAVISVMGLGIRIPILYFVEPVMESLAVRFNLQILPVLDATHPGGQLHAGDRGDHRDVLEFLRQPLLDLQRCGVKPLFGSQT